MAIKLIKKIQDNADRLYELRKAIGAKEEAARLELEAMKLERDTLQDVLIYDMSRNGLSSLKVKDGNSFFVGTRKGVEVKNEALAFNWCIKNAAVKPDLKVAAQILKEMKELPEGFEAKETQYISVRKATDK